MHHFELQLIALVNGYNLLDVLIEPCPAKPLPKPPPRLTRAQVDRRKEANRNALP